MIMRAAIGPVVAYCVQINMYNCSGEGIVMAVCFIVELITGSAFFVYIG